MSNAHPFNAHPTPVMDKQAGISTSAMSDMVEKVVDQAEETTASPTREAKELVSSTVGVDTDKQSWLGKTGQSG